MVIRPAWLGIPFLALSSPPCSHHAHHTCLPCPLTICTHPVHLPQARQHPTVGGRVTGRLTTLSKLGNFRSRPAEKLVYVHQSVHVAVLPLPRRPLSLGRCCDEPRWHRCDLIAQQPCRMRRPPMPSVLSGMHVLDKDILAMESDGIARPCVGSFFMMHTGAGKV